MARRRRQLVPIGVLIQSSSGEIFPGNFSVIRKDRADGRASGGVFIGFKNDLVLTHRPDLDAECEVVWAQLQIQGAKSIFIGSFYRPPNGANGLDELNLSISKIFKNNVSPNIWLGGDFNLGDINWSCNNIHKYATNGPLCEQLLGMTTEYNLTQMISEPTHHTEDSDSLLDLFLPPVLRLSITLFTDRDWDYASMML